MFDEQILNKWSEYYIRAFEGETYVVENEMTVNPENGDAILFMKPVLTQFIIPIM